MEILDTTDRAGAIEKGFGGFNAYPHLPIELEEGEKLTITVRQGDHLVTFCIIPNECVDIATHRTELDQFDINANIVPHTTIGFKDSKRSDYIASEITAVLLSK